MNKGTDLTVLVVDWCNIFYDLQQAKCHETYTTLNFLSMIWQILAEMDAS